MCLVIRISDPLAHCFWGNWYAKTPLHEQIEQTMILINKTLLVFRTMFVNKSFIEFMDIIMK